jgi:dipeptidyl aminopeptidase/acylaminoacyl peptidase
LAPAGLVLTLLIALGIPAFGRAGAGAVAPDVPQGADAARDAELARQAQAIVDAFSNTAAVFTRDGRGLVFSSDRDGLPQLYLASAADPASPAVRLTHTRERILSGIPLPDGQSVLFRSDRGADENWSFYRVGLDGEGLVELTSAEKLNRDAPIVRDGMPDTLFFSARPMSEAGATVYAQKIAPGAAARKIYHQPRPGRLVDVSRDGRRGLYADWLSRSESALLVLDLASGAARRIYPAAGSKVTLQAARFSADGERIFVASDGGAEQALLLALDGATGEEKARYVETRPATAAITSIEVSKRGDRLALGLAAGAASALRLLDARTLTPLAPVEMPLGSGAPVAFSEDGTRFTVNGSTPNVPGDVFAVDAQTGKVTPLRRDDRPSLAGLRPVEAKVTEIEAFDGKRIPVNVYLPADARGKLPVLVRYHGGPADVSTIRWNSHNRFFGALGYAVVEPNVRGSSGFGRAYEEADNGPKRLDAFQDVATAARWVASQPWADKDSLVVYGGSYGGYTTLIALTRQPEIWRAGVNLFGVAKLRTFLESTSGSIRHIFRLEFGELGKDDAFLDSISPLADVDRIVDPLFVYAGANDPRVPRSESDLIVAAVRKKGVPCEYMVKDNEGHSLAREENLVEFLARAARFLEKHLALGR